MSKICSNSINNSKYITSINSSTYNKINNINEHINNINEHISKLENDIEIMNKSIEILKAEILDNDNVNFDNDIINSNNSNFNGLITINGSILLNQNTDNNENITFQKIKFNDNLISTIDAGSCPYYTFDCISVSDFISNYSKKHSRDITNIFIRNTGSVYELYGTSINNYIINPIPADNNYLKNCLILNGSYIIDANNLYITDTINITGNDNYNIILNIKDYIKYNIFNESTQYGKITGLNIDTYLFSLKDPEYKKFLDYYINISNPLEINITELSSLFKGSDFDIKIETYNDIT